METIRLLKADEIECKVSTISEKGCSLLLYKTARTDMDLLDEVYGAMNWECEYKEIKGNMYCGISVFNEKANKWVTKWDCGVESAFGDKEKGEASDAFKRAGFKWGIGRELYTAPFIWINANSFNLTQNKGKWATYDKFAVKSISYNENREICSLSIVNLNNNKVVFEQGKNIEPKQTVKQTADTKISTNTKLDITKFASRYADIKNGDESKLIKHYLEKFKVTSLLELTEEQGKSIVSELRKLVERRIA